MSSGVFARFEECLSQVGDQEVEATAPGREATLTNKARRRGESRDAIQRSGAAQRERVRRQSDTSESSISRAGTRRVATGSISWASIPEGFQNAGSARERSAIALSAPRSSCHPMDPNQCRSTPRVAYIAAISSAASSTNTGAPEITNPSRVDDRLRGRDKASKLRLLVCKRGWLGGCGGHLLL